MKMYDCPQSVDKYLDCELECSCGKIHRVAIKDVVIGDGVLNRLADYVRKYGFKRPYIICDEITYKIAGERCKLLLEQAGLQASAHILAHMGFDEATLGEIVISLPADCDLMIAVGTGSISDMIRYTSYKLHLPCFTVATAAPMDGFAASVGIMNVNGLKATMPAHSSMLIMGDSSILKGAPYRMTIAGFGDLIGKITCLADWRLARIIKGEHYCESIVRLVESCVDDVIAQSAQIKAREPQALGRVMEGLVLSGVAISLYGDSRPASGAEHHLSHYWETVMGEHAMHGEQVAVGTVLVLKLIEELLAEPVDFDFARKCARDYDEGAWRQQMRDCYGAAAAEVIELEEKTGKNKPSARLSRIDSMQQRWGEITAQLKALPSSQFLSDLLCDVGCPSAPSQIGVDNKTLKDSFMYCKEIRPRYTVFQTVYDLGLLDKLSDRVIAGLK